MIIKVISETLGGHVHERVFVGPDRDHLALAGELVFGEEEAIRFEGLLALAASASHGAHQFIFEAPQGYTVGRAARMFRAGKERP
jgi:hypothetical protein